MFKLAFRFSTIVFVFLSCVFSAFAAPTDITLTSTIVDENVSWWTTIWIMWNVDTNTWSTYTYTLVSWTWDTDNSGFTISWTNLDIVSVPDFETKSSYAIRLNVNDWSNNFEKQFTITVNNLNEAPTDMRITSHKCWWKCMI